MEKIDLNFEEEDDFTEMDDVLDGSFFASDDLLQDMGEDESNYDSKPSSFRSLSEL